MDTNGPGIPQEYMQWLLCWRLTCKHQINRSCTHFLYVFCQSMSHENAWIKRFEHLRTWTWFEVTRFGSELRWTSGGRRMSPSMHQWMPFRASRCQMICPPFSSCRQTPGALTAPHSHSAALRLWPCGTLTVPRTTTTRLCQKKLYTVRVLQQKTGNALKACALKNWNTLFTLTVKLIKVQNCALEKWKTLYTLTVPIFLNPKFDLFVNNHFQIKSLIVF